MFAQRTPIDDGASDESAAPFTITEINQNSQLLQRITWSTNDENGAIASSNFVTQLETGSNYWDPNSAEWLPPEEIIELLPGGAGSSAHSAQDGFLFAEPLQWNNGPHHALRPSLPLPPDVAEFFLTGKRACSLPS